MGGVEGSDDIAPDPVEPEPNWQLKKTKKQNSVGAEVAIVYLSINYSESSDVVDDNGFATCEGAKEAVDEFLVGNNDFVIFHLITGQYRLVKMR